MDNPTNLNGAYDKALWDAQFYKLLTKARDTYAKLH